jgi:hypothetical protein
MRDLNFVHARVPPVDTTPPGSLGTHSTDVAIAAAAQASAFLTRHGMRKV